MTIAVVISAISKIENLEQNYFSPSFHRCIETKKNEAIHCIENELGSARSTNGRADGWTDGRTDGRTDTPSYRDGWTQLKNNRFLSCHKKKR